MSVANASGPTTVIGVRLTAGQIEDLDRYRAELGESRGGALRLMFDVIGDRAFGVARGDVAAAKDAAEALEPLRAEMVKLTAMFSRTVSQRGRLGGLINQMVHLANSNKSIDPDAVRAVERKLDELVKIDQEDSELVAEIRRVIARCTP